MPGKIKVKILAGRNLPVMDRSSDTTDAYVEIKFGNITYKTDVCRKSLNPQWNSEWYKFEVEDAELQDEPLQIRLMDHDTYSANDAIGKVYINLNPLLLPGVPPPVKNIWTLEASMNSSTGSQGGSIMTGWLPVFDTMHGIRGEVNIIVKVELFLDFNKFRQSSCGVTFFYSSIIPHGYHAQVIHGFVEELVVSDDPEYKWIDKIRTPRASNEARQTLFLKLSNEVQRKIGLKALDLGGNAVIGYLQNFDLEGESGIVARGIGTVVTLVKLHDFPNYLSQHQVETGDDVALQNVKANKPYSWESSESGASSHSLSHQQQHSFRQHVNQQELASLLGARKREIVPMLGSQFPLYGKNVPIQPKTPLKLVEYSSARLRQAAQSTWNVAGGGGPDKRSGLLGSSLSLSIEDPLLIDESSMRMLALEDMRGEPQTSRFSRSIRNLRQLPQSVLARRTGLLSAAKTSVDLESDADSIHSSTWSIYNTDSTSKRGSSIDLQEITTVRKKRFIRRKNNARSKAAGESMAALLIKSVHASTGALPPLDSVKEDRETPTPSPVNFTDSNVPHFLQEISIDESVRVSPLNLEESSVYREEQTTDAPENATGQGKILLVSYSKLKASPEKEKELRFPNISSSESDTSSSDEDQRRAREEDDDFQLTESSTNYNILDDTLSLLDPSSPEADNCSPKISTTSLDELAPFYQTNVALPLLAATASYPAFMQTDESITRSEIADSIPRDDRLTAINAISNQLEIADILTLQKEALLESEFSSDIDSDLAVSAATSNEHRLQRRTRKISSSSSPTRASTEKSSGTPHLNIPMALKFDENDSSPRPQLQHQLSAAKTEVECSESSDEEYYGKRYHRLSPLKIQQERKHLLIDQSNDESEDSGRSSGKAMRKVERKETVIYKGPREPAKDEQPSTTSLHSSKNSRPATPDANHLQVPQVNLMEIAPRTPYPTSEAATTSAGSAEELRLAELFCKKYRQTCMLDLIRLIDGKLLSNERSESMRRRGKRPTLRRREQSPSPPDSPSANQRKTGRHSDGSGSPDSSSLDQHHHRRHHRHRHHHRHEHHHRAHRNNHAHQQQRQQADEGQRSSPGGETPDAHGCQEPVDPSPAPQVPRPPRSPASPGDTGGREPERTNTANTTDHSCVSLPLSSRRSQQQQQQQQQQLEGQQQQQATISPAGQQQQQQQQQARVAHSPATRNSHGIPLHRRSSDSDLSITPKGNSLTGSDRSMAGYLMKPGAVAGGGIARTMNQEALEMLEYPFITMQQYPPGFVLHIGGLVSARSVKLLERISNLEEPEGRDSWWTEIRMEVRSHARALACNVVIGYKEETSICDDVCILSGSGTAAVINLHSTGQDQENILITHVQSSDNKQTTSTSSGGDPLEVPGNQQQQQPQTPSTAPCKQQRLGSESNEQPQDGCSLCHLPYNKSSMNFQVNVSKCAVCRRAKVPDVLFTTIELPETLTQTGRGSFIHALVCKAKKDLRGELNAKETSDCLPFLEYELHSLLLNKLRVRGMNAIFGLKVQVSLGERLLVGLAVGTAVYLTALPAPSPPQVTRGNSWQDEDQQLADLQKSLLDTLKRNLEFYQLKPLLEVENGRSMSDTDESEDELPELDLALGMKDVCVLEVDEPEDLDRISLLLDERPPNDFHVVNTETIPGLEDLEIVRNLQMFTQISRAKIPPANQAGATPAAKYFARLLQTVYFKLRRMVPCALCDLQFKVVMPEADEIQLSVFGIALGLGESSKYNKYRRRLLPHSTSKDQVRKSDESGDMIFSLDEDHAESATSDASAQQQVPPLPAPPLLHAATHRPRTRSPLRIKHTTHRHKHVPLKERYGVDITPLSYLPGGRIDRYLGNLNFFFIRESNSIRENGGLSGFIHSFVTEVLAIVRAHVTALGGNAMVAFFMTQCVLLHSPHKNQGQCLINVGGDVVSVSYFGSEKAPSSTTTGGGA